MKTRSSDTQFKEQKNQYTSMTLRNHFIKRALIDALDYVNNTCILGASNKIADVERTHAWNRNLFIRYSGPGQYVHVKTNQESESDYKLNMDTQTLMRDTTQWNYVLDDIINYKRITAKCDLLKLNENPLVDPKFKLTDDQKWLLFISIMTEHARYGNCAARAAVVTKYLWEKASPVIERIEAVSMKTFDHVFVIVNRKGDIDKPETWGDSCWIIDPWYAEKGIIYPSHVFRPWIKRIEEFASKQIKQLEPMGLVFTKKQSFLEKWIYRKNITEDIFSGVLTKNSEITDRSSMIEKIDWEVIPSKNIYPTYDKNKRVNDYYYVPNVHSKEFNTYHKLKLAKENHYGKFKHCLEKITELRDPMNAPRFFKVKVNRPRELSSKSLNLSHKCIFK